MNFPLLLLKIKVPLLPLNLDLMLLQSLSNHPIHILDFKGKFSPSSFIPFCSFGKEFIGIKTDKFHLPVCNIFKPKIFFDQLCYETDLQEMKASNKESLMNQLEMGLTLAIDYNEDRQVFDDHNKNYEQDNHFVLHFDTISINFRIQTLSLDNCPFVRPCKAL